MSFVKEFKRVQRHMAKINDRHGFHDLDARIDSLTEVYGVPSDLVQEIRAARSAQRLMLAVSELSEALEFHRHGNPPDTHIPKFNGVEAELADAVIRLMNQATIEGLRLPEAIIAKTAYNARRPFRHGGKKF